MLVFVFPFVLAFLYYLCLAIFDCEDDEVWHITFIVLWIFLQENLP